MSDYTSASVISMNCLSERGRGDGFRKNQVYHAVCDRPLALGRISRTHGDLLCGRKYKEGVHAFSHALVTCPRCVELVTKNKLVLSLHDWRDKPWYSPLITD